MTKKPKPTIDEIEPVPPMKTKTWNQDISLRWNLKRGRPPNMPPTKTLEQLWNCVETGEEEWRPVPTVQDGKP